MRTNNWIALVFPVIYSRPLEMLQKPDDYGHDDNKKNEKRKTDNDDQKLNYFRIIDF